MYCSTIEIQPTGAATFRITPGSILDIMTYPFIPSTTMSGYLRRLCMLSAGHPLPETCVKSKEQDVPFYALPPQLIATGALPYRDGLCGKHKTHRKGPSNFKHSSFSKLYRPKAEKGDNIQLHTWEYYVCEKWIGYVLSEKKEDLAVLKTCLNWGCKIGKEGYAFVSHVGEPVQLQTVQRAAAPSTLVHAESIEMSDLHHRMSIYNLYTYHWDSIDSGDASNQEPSSIQGYIPIAAAYPHPSAQLTLEYLHDGKDLYIPTTWVTALKGGRDV